METKVRAKICSWVCGTGRDSLRMLHSSTTTMCAAELNIDNNIWSTVNLVMTMRPYPVSEDAFAEMARS